MLKENIDAFSFGGGVQSTAALVLASQGKLDCKTFIFANVGSGSENPDTLAYIRDYSRPFAEHHNLRVIEVSKGPDLYKKTLETKRSILIPVRMQNGAPGRRRCTFEWKIAVISRWIKTNLQAKGKGYHVGLASILSLRNRFMDYWEIISAFSPNQEGRVLFVIDKTLGIVRRNKESRRIPYTALYRHPYAGVGNAHIHIYRNPLRILVYLLSVNAGWADPQTRVNILTEKDA